MLVLFLLYIYIHVQQPFYYGDSCHVTWQLIVLPEMICHEAWSLTDFK